MGLSGNMPGRKLGDDGEIILTDKQEEFLDWLTGNRPEGESQNAFAERIGVHPRTLLKWKKDKAFLRRWDERMRETHAHPETLSRQLDVLNKIAMRGDKDSAKAIELYWRLVDRMSPDRLAIESGKSVEALSDEQIEQMLRAQASSEAERRGLRLVK